MGLLLCSAVLAQAQQAGVVQGAKPAPPGAAAPSGSEQPQQQNLGSISGIVVDPSGAAIAGAVIKLARSGQPAGQATQSGADGKFGFASLTPGPFQLTIASTGLATQTISGTLQPGEDYAAGEIVLALATAVTEVRVGPQVAEEQIKEQERQRVFGVVPNFYVSYIADAVPLDPKQKFELAWKTTIDPITFMLTGFVAGVQQADNDLGGYGQGAQGYGKRFAASYADTVTGTFIGGAMLPSLFKQDPRYFYKGTGSAGSRILYAIANAVICKGDNGHWQADYSGILGGLAAGGISNLYYPAASRGAGLVFENTGIGIGETAAANVLQEFVIRQFTRITNRESGKTETQPASRSRRGL